MEFGALAPYEAALRSAAPLRLRTHVGELVHLDVGRWLGGTDAADTTVLDRCRGPVLDVGCGPGRFVAALTARGVPALGVDIAEGAVALTRRAGHPALLRDVFGDVPGAGRWPTVLVMDGNVGIGGDPVRLLTRLVGLLAASGRLIVEAHPDPARDEQLQVRFAVDGGRPTGPEFGWAQVGIDALAGYATAARARVVETWTAGGRPFAVIARG
ncbi:MAG: class I SAM-dependent methyltransferase [Streptomyces sp.]|uniref:class I SAM-dependent methyltransferase n=1 Tax=Streptomyces sp. TaxID=1931 RepID=UPI0025EFCAA1|nr:class I SAM-dependent methyltransferase [Streptomyces sp.]MBW8792035.1 class I SAM-dependent methyltransferase [Streptomyces sp.]